MKDIINTLIQTQKEIHKMNILNLHLIKILFRIHQQLL